MSVAAMGRPDGRRFGLDVARALAIILVVLAHSRDALNPLIEAVGFSAPAFRWSFGMAGIELFFCLSGFLIGRLLLDIQRRNPSGAAIGTFLVRRWMRTLPLYYLALLVYWAVPAFDPAPREQLWSYVLLVQNLATPVPNLWFAVSWSLTIEEWSYTALPILAFWVCRRTAHPLGYGAALLCVIGIVGRGIVVILHDPSSLGIWDEWVRKLLVARLDAIAYGALVAVLAERWSRATESGAALIAAVLIGWSLWFGYQMESLAGTTGRHFFIPLTAIGFSLLLPWLSRLPAPRSMIAAPVVFVAKISYALYLVHWAFMFLTSGMPEPMHFLIYIGGSVLVATILSYGIEQPIMRMRPRQI